VNERNSKTRRSRAATVALVAALLIGGAGPGVTGVDAARNRQRGKELQIFSNPTPIAIPSNAMAVPSAITVSGFDTPIADVDVSLNILTHPTASDLDMLLVGPGGQMALIMSDAGFAAANDSLSLSDQAANQLPESDPLVSGTFQPTNYDFSTSPDTFVSPPAPVATPPSGSSLAVFNGTNANGTWRLFISEEDNVPVETGTLAGGWTLRITTASGVPDTGQDQFQAQAGKTLTVPAPGVLSNDSDPDGDALTALLAGQPKKGKVTLQADGSFTYRPNKKARGTDSFAYLAQDSTGLSALETVSIQVKGKGKKKKGKK
jgi:subtilisin-like proprotein convertase family protein